jgi:hypothetical protein
MALPSQSARPIARRNNMYRRAGNRKKRSRGVVLLPLAAVVALVAWRFWPEGGGSSPDSSLAASEPGTIQSDRTTGQDLAATGGARGDDKPIRQPPLGSPTSRLMPSGPDDELMPRNRSGDDRPAAIEMGGTDTLPPPDDRAAPLMPRGSNRPAAEPDESISQSSNARIQAGVDLLARNKLVEGRLVLSEALLSGRLNAEDDAWVRDRLAELGERMVFSPEIVPGDPFAMPYAIQSGDALSRLPRKLGLQVDWRLIQRINRISQPHRIRVGQRLKLVTGPFHAIVDKSDYRMDILLGEGRERVYVCSFPIGLGEYNSTPEGRFRVRSESKLINPQWTNPRTRELFLADDPENPIGEHWIGLEGAEEHLEQVEGYGIHGTIEPESIGRQASMGCVRMRADDVALVYAMLVERVSTVTIRP